MLWDTSVFIDYLRNRTSSLAYMEQVRNGLVEGYCSVNTEAELWAGHRTDEERLRATAVLFTCRLFPWIALLHGSPEASLTEKAQVRKRPISVTPLLPRLRFSRVKRFLPPMPHPKESLATR